MGVVNNIIKKQPSYIKNVYYRIIPFKYRYDRLFRTTSSFLNEVEKWDYTHTKEFQFNQLRDTLIYAKNNIPYYGKLFSAHEFDTNIQSFEDVRKLPYLTKELVVNNFQDLIPNKFRCVPIIFNTSGSTGNKMKFLGDGSMYKKEAAYIAHSFKAHGSDLYNEWSVWIRRHSPKNNGDMIVVDEELRRIYMSAFHINETTIFDYVKTINDSKVQTLVTYPSTAFWLSCLLEKYNLKLPYVKHIHGASEKCLPDWGKKIKEVFGFDLKMHYGQIEKVSFAYQANNSQHYHESLTYSFTEVDENNIIVGTSFMNKVMPFIRYKTDDVVTLLPNPDLSYSSPLTIMEIDGRTDDMLVTDTGCKIPSVNFYTMMSKTPEVKMFQFYQKQDKSVTLNIVPRSSILKSSIDELRKQVIQRVGNLDLTINIVDKIDRDSSTGKLRCVITELK